MTLNYPRGEPISINDLSEKTDLSWATTKKYVQLLETLGRIAPRVSVDENGVTALEIGENLHDISDQEDIQLVIYLFTHAKIQGNPTAPLSLDEHSDVLDQYKDTIQQLDDLGWVECSDDTIKLTPEGVSIAGPAYSRIRNTETEPRSKTADTQITQTREISNYENVQFDLPMDPGKESKYTQDSQTETDWNENQNKKNFRTTDGISS